MNRDNPSSLCAAVMPNIFDAHVFPDLLLPIVLGNLPSPNLREFSTMIQDSVVPPGLPVPLPPP